jgi:hypothetical protein
VQSIIFAALIAWITSLSAHIFDEPDLDGAQSVHFGNQESGPCRGPLIFLLRENISFRHIEGKSAFMKYFDEASKMSYPVGSK